MEYGKGRNSLSDVNRPSAVGWQSAWGSWSSSVLRYLGCDRFMVEKARDFLCVRERHRAL